MNNNHVNDKPFIVEEFRFSPGKRIVRAETIEAAARAAAGLYPGWKVRKPEAYELPAN